MTVIVASTHLLGRALLRTLAGIEACLVGVALSSGAEALLREPSVLRRADRDAHDAGDRRQRARRLGLRAPQRRDARPAHRPAQPPRTGHRFPELTAQAQRTGRPTSVACGAGESLGNDALFAEADAALYRAKAAGRDRVHPGPGVALAAAGARAGRW